MTSSNSNLTPMAGKGLLQNAVSHLTQLRFKMTDSIAFKHLFTPRVALADASPEGQAAADDLEKIFAEQGSMMDKEEMMEAMLKKDNQSMTPYPFDKLMDNLRGFKVSPQELIDGCNIEVSMPLGNNFQLGAEWSMSNTKGSNVEFTTQVNNLKGNPTKMPDDMKQGIFKYSSDESASMIGVFKLPFGIQCQSQTRINDPSCEQVMNVLQFSREFHSTLLSTTYQGMQGQGIYQFTIMQSLSKQLQLGAQAMYSPMMPGGMSLGNFNWAAYYQTQEKKHQFCASFVPGQPKDNLTMSYLGKLSQRLQLFSELKMGGGSSMLGGFKMRFHTASITGYVTSGLKTYATYSKSLEDGIITLDFNSNVDFKNPKKACFFGVNVRMGMM